jgi:hypothetical protein
MRSPNFAPRVAMRLLPALLAVAGNAPAQTQAEAAEPTQVDGAKPTFIYTTPTEKNYLRAVLELEGVFVVGVMYYVTTTNRNWDLGYRWKTYEQKFRWDALGVDQNHFGTNFIGHPLGGSGYYVAARANHLGAFESFAFAFSGSLLWEYFGEITEKVSVNDMVVTPWAGVAIGEATLQLGTFFDRSGPEMQNRVLGATFAPFKSVNDWVDGLHVKRVRYGYPTDEWHRFDLSAAGVGIRRWSTPSVASTTGGVLLHFGERLARLPDFEDAGKHSFWFDDGNVTSMDLETIVTPDGLTDLSFRARVMLAGYYFRDAGEHSGGGGVIGPSTTFEYSLHDYARGARDEADRIALVQPLGVGFLHRISLGQASLATELHLGPALSGINAHAYSGYSGNPGELTMVLPLHHYYFGLGPLGTSDLELDWRSLEADLGLRAETYEVIQDSPPTGDVSIRDTRLRTTLGLGFRPANGSFVGRAFGRHTLRRGTMGTAHAETTELMWGVSLGGVF